VENEHNKPRSHCALLSSIDPAEQTRAVLGHRPPLTAYSVQQSVKRGSLLFAGPK
jgi:hypothetical protein